MSFAQIAGGIIEVLFQEAPYYLIKRIGSVVRWLFFRTKYNYSEIYKQDWNARVGILTILVIILFVIGIKIKFYDPPKRVERAKSEVNLLAEGDQVQSGDIIFQTSLSQQSEAIQLATHSEYSHCGIIFIEGKSIFVYEAIQPVKLTPIENWIARGKHGHFVVKRLINAKKILNQETLIKMKNIGDSFKGKNYDLGFDWSDEKIYCSELIWKIYNRAANIELGHLQKLGDFDLRESIVKDKLKERYGNKIPLDEPVISPSAIFNSDLLATIKSN